jgi:5,10-methylenetetrahydromethanopterin reductase
MGRGTAETGGGFRIGLGLPSLDYPGLRRQAAAAERGGFDFVSVGDNPSHMKDTYVSLSVVADATETCRIGTTTTSPLHGDPLVVAAATSSVAALAPHRLFLGLATGRARARVPLADLADHVRMIRTLWRGEPVAYRGEELSLSWEAQPVPIVIAASGPRGLRLAGELADGVIIEAGVTAEVVESSLEYVNRGLAASGREAGDIDTWWYLRGAIARNGRDAFDVGLGALATSCALVLGQRPEDRQVPPKLHAACRTIGHQYDMRLHLSLKQAALHDEIASNPSLMQYLMDRFALVGTPDDWCERIEALRTRGVHQVFCAAVVPDMDELIERVSTDVLPRV